MGAESSKESYGAASAELFPDAATRERNRRDLEEFQRNLVGAMFQQMTIGENPLDLMTNLTQGQSRKKKTGANEEAEKASTLFRNNRMKLKPSRSRDSSPSRYRPKSKEFHDPSSDTEDEHWIVSVADHLEARLKRFVRLGAIGQCIAEKIHMPRSDVLSKGGSQFQEKTCKRDHPAAHVVRVRINKNIELKYFEPLKAFVGHIQCVPKFANDWGKIGGKIDRIQERFLDDINSIDFKGNLGKAEGSLRRLKEAFLDALNEAIRQTNIYSTSEVQELKAAIVLIEKIEIRELFEKGRNGLHFLEEFPNWQK